MTDSQYKAKKWLMNYRSFFRKVKSDRKLLEALEAIVNKCVSTYESDGSGGRDIEKSKQRHEDALLEYSKQRAELESEELKLINMTNEVANVIKQIRDSDHKDIATDLYLRDMKWDQCMEDLHISKSTLDRKHREMLTKLAKILKV